MRAAAAAAEAQAAWVMWFFAGGAKGREGGEGRERGVEKYQPASSSLHLIHAEWQKKEEKKKSCSTLRALTFEIASF